MRKIYSLPNERKFPPYWLVRVGQGVKATYSMHQTRKEALAVISELTTNCELWRCERTDPESLKGGITDAWRNAKCKRCKSEALDYGSYRTDEV